MSAVNITQRLKIAGFFLNIAEWDRHIEITRQILNGIDSFEPYAAFLRLTKGKTNSLLEPTDVYDFLKENSLDASLKSIQCVIQLNDTKIKGGLTFEDFLKFTLARDNPKMRFEAAAKREIYEVEKGERLAEEVEYCLARLFSKSCEFVERLRNDSESQTVFGERYLFTQLVGQSDKLDFNLLKKYFTDLKMLPKDSEIIAILRIIDINDDGLIDRTEFEYFIGTVAGSSNISDLADRVKHRQTRDKYDQAAYSSKHTPTHSNTKEVRDRSGNNTASKQEARESREAREYQTSSNYRAAEPRENFSNRANREVRTQNSGVREPSKEESRYEREIRELRQSDLSANKPRYDDIRRSNQKQVEYTSVVRERRASPTRVEKVTERVTRIDDALNTPTRPSLPASTTYERSYRREVTNEQPRVSKPEDGSGSKKSKEGEGSNIFHEADTKTRTRDSGRKPDLTAYSPKHESNQYRRSYVNL